MFEVQCDTSSGAASDPAVVTGASGASASYGFGYQRVPVAPRPVVQKAGTSGSGEYFVTKTAMSELRRNAEMLSPAIKSTALALADMLDDLSLPTGTQLHCSWSDAGTLIAEWILRGVRFGFSFEPHSAPTWFHVNLSRRAMNYGLIADAGLGAELGRFLKEAR